MPHSTPSHLGVIILAATFGIFWMQIGLKVSFDIFPRVGSITVGSSLDSITFTVPSRLRLKQHFTN
jgi:hypothetical protein